MTILRGAITQALKASVLEYPVSDEVNQALLRYPWVWLQDAIEGKETSATQAV